MKILDNISRFLNTALILIGGVFLVGMIVLTCGNIFSRQIWKPIPGTVELMGYSGAIVTAFALGYTQMKRGHIAVDVLVDKFPSGIRIMLNVINNMVCLAFFSMAAWQIAVKATTLMKTGEVSETLRIIYYPFTYAVAAGCAVLSMVLLVGLLKTVLPEREGGN